MTGDTGAHLAQAISTCEAHLAVASMTRWSMLQDEGSRTVQERKVPTTVSALHGKSLVGT